MILPDVNLLVYAHDTRSREHEPARAWLEGVLSGDEPVALAWVVLLGFVRLTTNPRAVADPLPVDGVLRRVDALLAQPQVRIVHPGHRHGELLFGFLRALGAAGNLTTDAHLAALAVEHGCTLYSTDADFARFPGLDWQNPLS